ncbi:AbrB family transcriptional regulator [Aneurinibacillus migulanus]|uniref:AbrB family transcriptional regulator n=1 Tax=Aneurinibacillus migulanus TaxID=47500 RepID=A0A0D1XW35_ANEMI|nr:AbrB family transcriptional regulator [Aneurinibacillus migulanus]KON90809.1 AbrB family transcriptional regulator [Aneurinibacillus migulanus]GED16367.1 AbrB family transcriptional regulator [Aneurinibacillus migulanus]SDJ25494.1 transcriptional pleiotropic regulator of transition state genes [Aneurinibacillus migulanus]
MHETSIICKLDKLGRLTFPTKMRNNLGIYYGDGLEFLVNGEQLVLQKHAPGCIFCNSVTDGIEYKGKEICTSCLNDIKAIHG